MSRGSPTKTRPNDADFGPRSFCSLCLNVIFFQWCLWSPSATRRVDRGTCQLGELQTWLPFGPFSPRCWDTSTKPAQKGRCVWGGDSPPSPFPACRRHHSWALSWTSRLGKRSPCGRRRFLGALGPQHLALGLRLASRHVFSQPRQPFGSKMSSARCAAHVLA